MKAVIDTNIFISGIFWKGKPYHVLDAWKKGRFELITSVDIVVEIGRVLRDFEIKLPEDIVKEWTDLIMKHSIMVEPKDRLTVVKGDPADNKFLEAAVAGNADCIVTGDAHLCKLKQFAGIRIVSPKDFLESV